MTTKIVKLVEVDRTIMVQNNGKLFWENGKQIKTTLYKNRERVKIRSLKSSKNTKAFATYKVHRLVAQAFCGLSNGQDVHHKDHNPQNNNADNLLCVTPKMHTTLHKLSKIVEDLSMSPRIQQLQNKCRSYQAPALGSVSIKRDKRICGFNWKD